MVPMYIEARYPEQKDTASRMLNKDACEIVPVGVIVDKWYQWADICGDVRKVSTLIEPVLMEDNEDSMLYREVMRTGITV